MPSDCSGTYSFDFNAWIAAGADPAAPRACYPYTGTQSRVR